MYAACVFSGLMLASCSKTSESNTDLNATDENFALQTSQSNSAEITIGSLAAGKATNLQVKNFAQFMITEHQMAQTDLKNMAASVGILVRDSIDAAHMALANQLSAIPSGRAFDSAYIYSQVADHDMTIANFQTEINNGNHRDVKNYANIYLPHIQMHRQSADSIATAFFKK